MPAGGKTALWRRAALASMLALLAAAAPATAQTPNLDTSEADRCDFLDPAVCLFPWPNDYFTKADPSADTGRRLNLSVLSMPRNRAGKPIEPADYNRNDGFSPGQKIVTKVPGLETPEAFRQTGAVPIDDLGRSFDKDQPIVVINARTGRRHLIWSELDSNPADPRDVTLLIRPATNFTEGERYIVALRNLKGADGKKLEARPEFRAYRDGTPTSDPAIERRRQHMEEIFATLKKAGINRKHLYLAWDFTVASERNLSERMLSLRDDAFGQLGDENLADLQVQGGSPSFRVDSVEPHSDPRIARVVEGTFTVPCYLDTPGCPPGSRFAFAPGSDVPLRIPGNTVSANFRCNVPQVALDRGGARVSLYGHGLLGDASELNQVQIRDFAHEHNVVFCATDWDGMSFEDVPNVATILQDLSRFPTLTDRGQQGMLNFLYLGRTMLHGDGLASDPAFQQDGQSVLDRSRLFYDGNSQGGIMGGGLAAVAVDHEHAVLGVPGMNYSTLLRRSVDFDTYAHGNFEGAETPLGLYDNYPNELERPLVISLIQLLWDRAEANGYAHHMTDDPLPNTPAHKVMLHVAFGDHQVADITTEVEARTIGAHVYEPALDAGRPSVETRYGIPAIGSFPFDGSALVYWDSGPARQEGGRCVGTPAPPLGNVPPRECEDPHELPRREPEARLQKSEFLRIGGKVIDVCGGLPCYSGTWDDR